MRLLTLVLAVALLAPAVSFGQVRRIGANLNRPANNAFNCTAMPGPDAFGRPIPYPSFARTCTWFTTQRSLTSRREGTLVPVGRGTIRSVRVRVGPVTGPMRVVVLEALRGDSTPPTVDTEFGPIPGATDAICCKQVARTRVFVPRRNRVTTLRTNLRVRNSGLRDPRTGFAYFDILALSVLAPGVPVPAHNTGNYAPLGGPIGSAFYPALRQREERAGGAGVVGFVTLLNATWVRRR